MKSTMKRILSAAMILCLLNSFLSGCGSSAVAAVTEVSPDSQQEKTMDIPEMETAEIPEEDVETLLQAGLDTVAEESDLWVISAITDPEILMQLIHPRGSEEPPEGAGGKAPANMTPPDGEAWQQADGEKPERSGGNPPENMERTFPEGGMQEGNKNQGGGRQPGNRGGGTTALAIVISGTEDTTLAAEEVFTKIQLTAKELGYQANTMELTEDQQSQIHVAEGYAMKMILLINAQMPEKGAIVASG